MNGKRYNDRIDDMVVAAIFYINTIYSVSKIFSTSFTSEIGSPLKQLVTTGWYQR